METLVQEALEEYNHAHKQEKIAYRAKKNAMNEVADRLQKKYADEIIEYEEVFALGINSQEHREGTDIWIKITIEPTVKFEEVEDNFIDWRDNLKDKIDNVIEEDVDFVLGFEWVNDDNQ